MFCTINLIAFFIIALPIDLCAKQEKEQLPTSSPNIFELSAFNPIVEKVQSALKDVGFYMGVVDGRFNHDTEIAILKYQNSEGLPLNPIASKELVRHIQSKKQVQSLLNQLQIQRLNTMEEARKALLTHPETRDLVFGSIYNASQATKDNSEQCFLSPTTKCLLEAAYTSASAIFKNELRDWVLSDILVIQANAGLIADASKTIRKIIDPRLILVALSEIAKAKAFAGKSTDALNAASVIPDDEKRLEAMVAIAAIQADQRDMVGAAATSLLVLGGLNQIGSPLKQISLASKAVIILSKAGNTARANKELQKIKVNLNRGISQEQRSPALRHIANILAKTGRPKRALALLQNEPDVADHTSILVSAATVLAESGHTKQAILTAKRIRAFRYRSIVLSQIAVVQAKSGDAVGSNDTLELALKEAERTSPQFAQAYAYERICLALIEIGRLGGPDNFDQAVQTAGLIRDKKLFAHTLWSLTTERLISGDLESATQMKKKAEQATKQIKSLFTRVWLFSEIALEHFSAKRELLARSYFKRALAISENLNSAWGRSRALVRLASIHTKITDKPSNL